MLTLTHVLIAIAVVAGRALFVLISPIGRCPRCNGQRVVRHGAKPRRVRCGKCRGAGHVMRKAKPARCGKCGGTGRLTRGRPPRAIRCWLCNGAGRRERFGSRVVHQLAWSMAGEHLQHRIRSRYNPEEQNHGDLP